MERIGDDSLKRGLVLRQAFVAERQCLLYQPLVTICPEIFGVARFMQVVCEPRDRAADVRIAKLWGTKEDFS